MLSIETGIPPSVLYQQNSEDIATMVDVLEERARKHG